MPLKKGKSKGAFDSNMSHLIAKYRKTGKIGSSRPKNAEKARQQALAIAFSQKER
uniref:Uncharacterized protein n=1 Tax=viral metagenome TaxID=1070528 RepID=A0A6M3KB49_9ZZZZ